MKILVLILTLILPTSLMAQSQYDIIIDEQRKSIENSERSDSAKKRFIENFEKRINELNESPFSQEWQAFTVSAFLNYRNIKSFSEAFLALSESEKSSFLSGKYNSIGTLKVVSDAFEKLNKEQMDYVKEFYSDSAPLPKFEEDTVVFNRRIMPLFNSMKEIVEYVEFFEDGNLNYKSNISLKEIDDKSKNSVIRRLGLSEQNFVSKALKMQAQAIALQKNQQAKWLELATHAPNEASKLLGGMNKVDGNPRWGDVFHGFQLERDLDALLKTDSEVNHAEAIKLLENLQRKRQDLLGNDHLLTTKARIQLATSYLKVYGASKDKNKNYLALASDAYRSASKTPDVTDVMQSYASDLRRLGLHKESIAVRAEILELIEGKKDAQPRAYIKALDSLALGYYAASDYKIAIKWYRKALEVATKELGENDLRDPHKISIHTISYQPV